MDAAKPSQVSVTSRPCGRQRPSFLRQSLLFSPYFSPPQPALSCYLLVHQLSLCPAHKFVVSAFGSRSADVNSRFGCPTLCFLRVCVFCSFSFRQHCTYVWFCVHRVWSGIAIFVLCFDGVGLCYNKFACYFYNSWFSCDVIHEKIPHHCLHVAAV
jgi:hypothetical protein